MITTPQEFEDATTFELYLLENLYPAIGQQDSTYIDLRKNSVASVNISITESLCADAVDSLKEKLAPLLFGAAWKVLDLLLELALNRADIRPIRHDWTIAEKQQHALSTRSIPSVLMCSQEVWAALLRVYAGTVEHRNCLVHRTANVNATSGTLECVGKNNRPLKPLTRAEQVSLAKISGLVARAVVAARIGQRTEEHLKYYLDLLHEHSGLPKFGANEALEPVEIKLSLAQEDGAFFLDMDGVVERARKTFPTIIHFNLMIDVPGDSCRHLVAQAEDCPPGKTPVDLNAPPSWLKYR